MDLVLTLPNPEHIRRVARRPDKEEQNILFRKLRGTEDSREQAGDADSANRVVSAGVGQVFKQRKTL